MKKSKVLARSVSFCPILRTVGTVAERSHIWVSSLLDAHRRHLLQTFPFFATEELSKGIVHFSDKKYCFVTKQWTQPFVPNHTRPFAGAEPQVTVSSCRDLPSADGMGWDGMGCLQALVSTDRPRSSH